MISSATLTAILTFGLVLAASILQNPMVVGLVVGIPASYFGWQAYKRTKKLDEVAALAAQASSQTAATQQVIDGLNKMVDNLQDDNKVLRRNQIALTDRYEADKAAQSKRYDALKDECSRLADIVSKIDTKINGA